MVGVEFITLVWAGDFSIMTNYYNAIITKGGEALKSNVV